MATAAETMARRFARSLDASDWTAATSLLATNCEYVFRGETTTGANEIIGSYRRIDEWVKATFDKARYESSIEASPGREALINFRDTIDHGDQHLDFRCQQLITLGDGDLIQRITHLDIEGEPEKVERFNRACGVVRP